jgi:hypothetical protein
LRDLGIDERINGSLRIRCEHMDGINLAQVRDKRLAVVNTGAE